MTAPKDVSKATPGPWSATEVVFSKKDWMGLWPGEDKPMTAVRANWDGWTGDIVSIVWGDTDEEEKACAALIAAAPAMREALERVERILNRVHSTPDGETKARREALKIIRRTLNSADGVKP